MCEQNIVKLKTGLDLYKEGWRFTTEVMQQYYLDGALTERCTDIIDISPVNVKTQVLISLPNIAELLYVLPKELCHPMLKEPANLEIFYGEHKWVARYDGKYPDDFAPWYAHESLVEALAHVWIQWQDIKQDKDSYYEK